MTKASRRKRVDLTRIALVALDFDGVMTDNRVLVDQTGREAVWCNRADGLGVEMLKSEGLRVIVISTETNHVVSARCRKLRIPCIRGSRDKLTALRGVMAKWGLRAEQVAFVGNDINDLECLRVVGVPVAPCDAVPEVRRVVRLVTKARGGAGVVRELADRIQAARRRVGK